MNVKPEMLMNDKTENYVNENEKIDWFK